MGVETGDAHSGVQEGAPAPGPGDASAPAHTAAEQPGKEGADARLPGSQAKCMAKRARGSGVGKASRPVKAKAEDEGVNRKEKMVKVNIIYPLPLFFPPLSPVCSFSEGNVRYAVFCKT